MSLRGFEIKEGPVGANINGDGRVFALIGGGVAVAGKLTLGNIYSLRRPSDAVAIGIDADYDTDNSVQLYRHISEFYRMAGEGKELAICVVAQSNAPAAMVDTAKAMVVEKGTISDIVFAFNPEAGYTETLVDGLNSDVGTAIPALQLFAEWCDENDMPLHVILEGRGISDTLSALTDLRAMAAAYPKVSLVIGQDWNYADGLTTLGKKFADVGNFLGCVAAQNWNRNPGEVATMNLYNELLQKWTIGGLSNHKKYSEVYADLESLDEKGYIFPIKYNGRSGYWWNDGHTCAPVIIDAAGNLNQHTIYYSHTMDMSKRALRIAYLDEVKKVVELNNGKLPTGTVAYYNELGNAVFNFLAGRELISEGEALTDPNSDLLITKQLNVQFGVVPTGCVGVIKGTINLKSN